eukprot:s740_g14.t1
MQTFGVYWTEQEVVQQAIKARHPLDATKAVPKELVDANHFNLNHGLHDIISHRIRFLTKWLQRAKELSSAERQLKLVMDADVASAVKDKRIMVFADMLEDTGYPDMGVVSELKDGAELVCPSHFLSRRA